MVSHETWIPTYEELTVPQEINISISILKAAAIHMSTYCEPLCKEFMLCRQEEEDPRRCLSEGRDVTACGVKFLQLVKKNCRQEFEKYAHCVDTASGELFTTPCIKTRRGFDRCVFDKLGQERPERGYFAKPHVHVTNRPKPPQKDRDFREAAAKVADRLPEDYPIRKDYKGFHDAPFDWLSGGYGLGF